MIEKTLAEQVLEERKFLHDLSNQLVVAQGMGGFVQRALEKSDAVAAQELERLGKNLTAVKKMVDLVKSRRDELHKMSEELENS